MASGAALYTPEVLALATSLALHPLNDSLPLRGEARSRSCGSAVEIGLATAADGTIARLGVRAHSCAIGQAATALFVAHAPRLDRARIEAAHDAIAAWLNGLGDAMPEWPGLDALSAARAYPARHGAILLAWRAALAALPTPPHGG